MIVLHKSSNRNTDLQKNKMKLKLIDEFNDIFDIVHSEVISMTYIEGDRKYFSNQKQLYLFCKLSY